MKQALFLGGHELVAHARDILLLSQRQFAPLLSVSLRTLNRIETGKAPVATSYLVDAAALVYPKDRAFAETLAKTANTTLVALGLEKPPAPAPSPVEVQVPPSRLPALNATQVEMALVDSVLVAAAEAINSSPQTARAALTAAFGRARDLGLSLDILDSALRPAKPAQARPRSLPMEFD